MGRLIKIHDIDEFSGVQSVPDAAINSTIISSIKKLDEETQLERFTREILFDPNETPHGPTEIADILTSHVHVRGEKQLAAFVLKGKSYQRVSSKEVSHQFMKLRQIPNLGLMVFGAIGNIQDDAQRDFLQVAIDSGCNYIIIDAHDWARLFIAFEKVCPKDGLPFDDSGCCQNGHVRDEGIMLEMEVREKTKYTIMKQTDGSHAGAKRYTAIITIDRHYPRETIRTIIKEATETLRHSNYYRNDQTKARWGKTHAHVVWLYIAYDIEDIRNANWVCRTSWIYPKLPDDFKPMALNGNENLDGIEIEWNDSYKSCKELFERYKGTKEEVVELNQIILNEIIKLAERAIWHFQEYSKDKLTENVLIKVMQEMEPRVNNLYFKSHDIPQAPEDCEDYAQACQLLFGTIHDFFLYYSEKGLKTWPAQNRNVLMNLTIKRYYEDLERVKFEEKKIH